MYRGFDLNVPNNFFSKFIESGSLLHQKNKGIVSDILEEYRSNSGDLLASKMTAAWFPKIDAQVFISHAHKDSDIALGLSGHLHDELGISSFIDSTVWGYSDDLLKILDDEFCYNDKSKTYDYRKRNRSTAHVHMMLSVAISQMINKCECIIFMNTPQSISSVDYIKGSTTDSPWIYSEISMTSLIQKRSPTSHRLAKSVISTESLAADSNLTIQYEVDLSHLSKLSATKYNEWVEQAGDKRGNAALDILYNLIK